MTATPSSPRLLKRGIVLIDPETVEVLRIILAQYNSDTLTRGLQIPGVNDGTKDQDRSKVLRLKGPFEAIKLETEIRFGKGRSS